MDTHRCSRFVLLPLVFLVGLPFATAEELAAPPGFKHLGYRNIGPAAGGRVCRVAGVPGDPLVYYAATAGGGVWKSDDGGLTWKAVTDATTLASVGSIAVAPSDANVIYAGSGEANIRGDVIVGDGIYKSTDAGKTWKHVWKQEGQIGTLIVHPSNPDIAFAAVLGHAFGPNPERGVYRTTDGGRTWKQVLSKNADTGASDVCFDPSNPRVLFAGLWQTRRKPWELTSGGPGSGLWMSRDGGDTWKHLGPNPADVKEPGAKGLPPGPWGKIGVAVSPADNRRVFALIEADKGGLYRSNDGGESWSLASDDRNLRQRAWYYSTITLDPRNPDAIWCPQVSLLHSIDGGKTFQTKPGPHHGDHHDLWIDPKNPRRMINGNDGGINITTNGGENWYSPPLPISQFYHVAADNRVPYHVSGAMQDLGTAAGPSSSLTGSITPADWYNVGGGEAGFTAPSPSDPDIVYASEYGGYISRYDHRTKQVHNISIYPYSAVGKGGSELRYRFQWTAPILISPHDPNVIYHGGNVLFKTSDAGQHWTKISPDLTRDDKSKEQWSGGPITGDNTGAEIYCTIFALAESPKQKGILWAGSDDGLVHISRDGGKNWDNVTKNIPNVPEWGTIDCIEASPFDAGTAYVVVDAHRLDDMKPYLYQTTDFGKTWKSLSAKVPQDVFLHAVREDPKRKGLLYAATDRGVACSHDGGKTWQSLKLGMPVVSVHDLIVKGNDLVVATHGRSIWIFDDLTPIRESAAKAKEQDAVMFPPAPATRYRYGGGSFARGGASDRPHGALLYYQLKKKPKDPVKLEIIDAKGLTVVTLSSKADKPAESASGRRSRNPGRTPLPAEEGVNRAVWDLTYTGPTIIQGSQAWPPGSPQGPLVNPGTYTLKFTVDGKTLTASLVVVPDPRVHIQTKDLDEQLGLALQLRDQITRLAKIVTQIRSLKGQLAAKKDLWKDQSQAQSLLPLEKDLSTKLEKLEGRLHNAKAKIPYDLLAEHGGAQLYSQMFRVYYTVIGSDNAPTQGVREMAAENIKGLDKLDAEFKKLVTGDLAQLNDAAKKQDVPTLVLPK